MISGILALRPNARIASRIRSLDGLLRVEWSHRYGCIVIFRKQGKRRKSRARPRRVIGRSTGMNVIMCIRRDDGMPRQLRSSDVRTLKECDTRRGFRFKAWDRSQREAYERARAKRKAHWDAFMREAILRNLRVSERMENGNLGRHFVGRPQMAATIPKRSVVARWDPSGKRIQ